MNDGCPDVLYFEVTGDADNDGIEDHMDNCPTASKKPTTDSKMKTVVLITYL